MKVLGVSTGLGVSTEKTKHGPDVAAGTSQQASQLFFEEVASNGSRNIFEHHQVLEDLLENIWMNNSDSSRRRPGQIFF